MQEVVGKSYYDENYGDYESQNSPGKLRFYLTLMKNWVSKGSAVFELGTGLGNFLALAAQYYECSGCDVNTYGVACTQKKAPNANLYEGSYETIPQDGSQQAVIAWDVLEHLPDLDDGLKTIHNRLTPKGYLLGVVPVYDGPLGWLVHLLDRDPTHVTKWSRQAWLDKLSNNHFEVIEHGGILRKLFLGRWYAHFVRPQSLLRWSGVALYFVARKV